MRIHKGKCKILTSGHVNLATLNFTDFRILMTCRHPGHDKNFVERQEPGEDEMTGLCFLFRQQREGLTSGLRLLTSRTQCPAEMEGNPSLVAPGRDREARAPGRAGTVRPG